MHSPNITFVIFTQNEEKRIEYPIKCLLPYGEVLISDDNSTDNTVAVSTKLGAKVIKRQFHKTPVENKEEADFIFKQLKTDWVFWGFADEMIPKTCLDLYTKIAKENKYKIVVQNIKTLFFDNNSVILPGLINMKFFRKDSLDFTDNKIHQIGKFAKHVRPNDLLYLPPIDEYSIYHFSVDMTENLFSKYNIYTSVQARDMKSKISRFKVVTAPFAMFLTHYFFLGGWMYGIKGFIISVRFAIYSFLVYSKKYEIDNNITAQTIEEKFVKKKIELLRVSPKSTIIVKLWSKMIILPLSLLHKHYKFKRFA